MPTFSLKLSLRVACSRIICEWSSWLLIVSRKAIQRGKLSCPQSRAESSLLFYCGAFRNSQNLAASPEEPVASIVWLAFTAVKNLCGRSTSRYKLLGKQSLGLLVLSSGILGFVVHSHLVNMCLRRTISLQYVDTQPARGHRIDAVDTTAEVVVVLLHNRVPSIAL